MRKIFYIACLLLFASVSIAADREVGSGKTYATITAAHAAASAGDTILVYDGIYPEKLTVTKSVTIKSVNEWGAVMSGTGVTLGVGEAALVLNANVTVIGMKFINYLTYATSNQGVILINNAGDYSSVKYCYFVSNETTSGNSGMIKTMYANGITLRGNFFTSNTLYPGDGGSIDTVGAYSSTIELNYFGDSAATAGYSLYHHVNGHSTTIRYNYFRYRPNRFRQTSGGGLTVSGNIARNYIQLHDQTTDDFTEYHDVNYNTFLNSQDGIFLVRADECTFTRNVFLNTRAGILINWGTSENNTITYNWYDDSTPLYDSTDGSVCSGCTINNNTQQNITFNATTGATGLEASAGANLKIDAWPYTTQAGGALQTDYPYGGADTSPPSLSGASPSGAQPNHVTPREVSWDASDPSGVTSCRYSSDGDESYADMADDGTASTTCASGTHCFNATTAAETSYNFWVACTDGTTANTASDNLPVSWTEGAATGSDAEAPVMGTIGFSPDPETCADGTTQEFSISFSATDDSLISCGALFTSGEGSFAYTDSGTYVAMTCAGGATSCESGSTMSYSPNLTCNSVDRNYSFACWDTAGNVTSFSAATRITITPPSSAETVVSNLTPYDSQADVAVSTTVGATLSNADGLLSLAAITKVALNGTEYDCEDAELVCSEVTPSTVYTFVLTPPSSLSNSTLYTVTVGATGLTTDYVWEFVTVSSSGTSSEAGTAPPGGTGRISIGGSGRMNPK